MKNIFELFKKDLKEQKQEQEQITFSDLKKRWVYERLQKAVIIYNNNGYIYKIVAEWNEAIKKWEYPLKNSERFKGVHDFIFYVADDEISKFWNIRKKFLGKEKPVNIEFYYISKKRKCLKYAHSVNYDLS